MFYNIINYFVNNVFMNKNILFIIWLFVLWTIFTYASSDLEYFKWYLISEECSSWSSICLNKTPEVPIMDVFIVAWQSNAQWTSITRSNQHEELWNFLINPYIRFSYDVGWTLTTSPYYTSSRKISVPYLWAYNVVESWKPDTYTWSLERIQFWPDFSLMTSYEENEPTNYLHQRAVVKYTRAWSSLIDEWYDEDIRYADRFLYRIRQTQKSIKNEWMIPNTKAFIWYQWEADMREIDNVNNYKPYLLHLIDRVRNASEKPELPVIIVKIAPSINDTDYDNEFRLIQQDIAESDDNIFLLDIDDIPKRWDDLHYSVGWYIEIWERIFNLLESITQI